MVGNIEKISGLAGKIREFWDNQAKEYGSSYKTTIPDKFLKELEIEAILKYIPYKGLVADVGCGNGYSDFIYADERSEVMFECFDISERMIEIAKKENNYKKTANLIFNVLDTNKFNCVNRYDAVITDRCLINLEDINRQKKVILKIVRSLKSNGIYIMCEDSLQGLEKLNRLRKTVGLDEITVRWHNKYIDEDILHKLKKEKLIEICKVDNFSAFYYMASRVINGKIAYDNNEEPAYDSSINKIARDISLSDNFGDCTPLKIFIIKGTQVHIE